MKSLVSVLLLKSFVLSSKNVYIGTVVRESDEVYSQETFENFSNSSWTKKDDSLKIKETTGEQGHVLEMDLKMDGDETGILETNVALPGDCVNVAILYISFKLFLSGYNHSLTSTFNDPNPDLKWSLTNLRVPDSPELTLTNLARLMASEGEWVSYKMEVHINMDSPYVLRLEMKASMLEHQVLQVDDIILEYAPVLNAADTQIYGFPTVFNCTALEATTSTTTTSPTTTLPVKNENATTSIAANSNDTVIDPNSTLTTTTLSKLQDNLNLTTTEVSVIDNNTTSTANETADAAGIKSGEGDNSLYGYAGEVVLICLTVLFLLLFIVMVVKYHLLKTRFGGYDVGEPGQGRSNPGYEVQMSYRDEN